MELDSHADTCAFGNHCLVLNDTGAQVSVDGFTAAVGTVTKVQVVTAAIAYDDPNTLQTHILIFHQALYIPTMDRHLLATFQLRDHGVIVNETPLLHTDSGQWHVSTHTLHHPDCDVVLPLTLEGTMSGLDVRQLTWEEIDNIDGNVVHLHMTSSATWDPHSPHFA